MFVCLLAVPTVRRACAPLRIPRLGGYVPVCAMEMRDYAAFYTLASAAPPASDMDDCNDADSLSFS